MNWLDRARCEIAESAGRPTADTAERVATAVLAVPDTQLCAESRDSIGSNGSVSFQEITEAAVLAEEFEERAAIMEFDGGLIREDAERAAQELVFNHRKPI